MKKEICVVTGSRAEYGLLKSIIKKLNKENILQLVVTGTHLSKEFGHTLDEILEDEITPCECIEVLLSSDSAESVNKAIALTILDFSNYFARNKPDIVILLGDRFEIFAVATAASVLNIPIAHIHGGETTEGSKDEVFRHCITKMSTLHFTSCEEYRKRVIQLGQQPNTVFNVGALGVENILNSELLTKTEVYKELSLKEMPYIVVTFHPITAGVEFSVKDELNQLLEVISILEKDVQFVITKANADQNGRYINNILEKYCDLHENAYLFSSLGVKKYLSAVKYSKMVIGNSSSGILEVPSFGIPTVNIGNRQAGRLQAKSIINCKADFASIMEAIKKGSSEEFLLNIKDVKSPYGNGETSGKILDIIHKFINGEINVNASFYDI